LKALPQKARRGSANRPAALASGPILKQDRSVTSFFATAAFRNAAASGGARAAGANARGNNNNRNNASLPRAGD